MYSVLFHLYKIQNQAKPNCSNFFRDAHLVGKIIRKIKKMISIKVRIGASSAGGRVR